MPLTKNRFLTILTVLLSVLAIFVAFFGISEKNTQNNNTEVFAEEAPATPTLKMSGSYSTYGSFSSTSATINNCVAILTFTAKSEYSNFDFTATQSAIRITNAEATISNNFNITMANKGSNTYQMTFVYQGSADLPNEVTAQYNPSTPTYNFSSTITPENSLTLNVSSGVTSGTTVTHGTAIVFSFTASTGYSQKKNIVVKYNVAGGSYATLTASSGTYTIPANSVKGDINITATVSLNTYTLTMPTGTGYSATITSDGGTTLTHGVEHKFIVEIATGYTKAEPGVRYTPQGGSAVTLSGTKSGNIYSYTIPASAITTNITIGIQVSADTYTFSLASSGTGYNNAKTTSGVTSNTATYGTNIVFQLTVTQNYNQTEPVVSYTINGATTVLTKTSVNGTTTKTYVYTIEGTKILGDITTSVTTTLNYYTITINPPTSPTVQIAFISGFRTTTNGNVTANYNETIYFSVVDVVGYTLSVSMTNATLSSSGGVYSAKITKDASITITANENTYIFTEASGTGYTFAITGGVNGSSGNYTIGHAKANIVFTVTLLSGYTSSTPVVTYRVGGGTANTLSGNKNGNTYTYTIAKENVTNNIQVFVSGVSMQAYSVTANVNSTYATFEGESSIEHGKAYTFTLTMTSAYTKTDISSGYVNYTVAGANNTSLSGSKVSGSIATYRFTIVAEKTTGSIVITFTTTGISKNTYTVTVTNTKSVTVPRSYQSWGTWYYYYYFNGDSASTATYNSRNTTTGFAFLFLMNNSSFRPYTDKGTTYYPTYVHSASSVYYTNTFNYEHGVSVSISVRSYMDSSGGYVQTDSSDLAEREVTIKNLATNTSTKNASTTQTNTYTVSSAIAGDYEITIGLKVNTVNFHSPVDYASDTSGFPTSYSTQIALTEAQVTERDANGTMDISRYAGYTYTTSSPATVNSGESYTLSLTLLTAKGFSGTPVVKYWYKLRNNGSYSSSAVTVNSSGNNTFNIPANANYTDIYISVTGIERTKYSISLPESDSTKGFSRAHVGEGTITDATQYTYATTYQFSVTVLRDNGWYCSNKNDDGSTLIEQLGTPVVKYSVSGGSATALNHTSYQFATTGTNVTYFYSFTVTGATEITISGFTVQTFSVRAVYIAQDGSEFWSDEGSVEAPTGFQGGQIVPISTIPVIYGGTFKFSVYINTSDGWNGNSMIVRGRFASATQYATLTKQSDGSYEYTGSTANENGIVENFVIAISGIVSDSYYISLPITNGVTFEVLSSSSYVLKGNDFSFSAEVRADQGWSAGTNNQDLVLYYYTSSNFSADSLVGALSGTYNAEQNKTIYVITNIQSSLYIKYVSGLVQATFSVSIETSDSSYTTNIDTGTSIVYGSVYEFTVTVATGYDESTLTVYYKMAGQIDDYVVLVGNNGVYRTQAVVGNISIKITPAVLLYFNAVINDPASNGFTISYADGNDPEAIPFGSSFTCYISKLASHEGTLVVSVTREGSLGSETISAVEGTGNRYVISNVRSNIAITVSGLSLKTFTITFSSDSGYTIDPVGKTLVDNKVTVNYGEQLQFKMSITAGYNGNAPSVIDSLTATSYTPAGGIYTISDYNAENVAIGIIQTHNIVVSNVTLNTYSISLPSVTTGFNITYDTALDLSSIPYGTNFAFEIELLEGYKKASDFVVRASIGGSAETQLVDTAGVFSINNIQSNIIISVSGVERKTFSVTLPTDDGYSLSFIEGDVSYGNSFTFSININTLDGYYEAETGVKVYYQTYNETENKWNTATELTASRGIYTISNIVSNISVSISGIIKGEYQITLPTSTTGFSIVTVDGDTFTSEDLVVDYNGSFSFKINIDRSNGYFKGDSFKVSYKITNSENTPTTITESNEIYTISPVINNLVIYVEGVEMTYFNITLPAQEARVGYTIYTNDSTTVAYKQNFTFSINVDTQNGYDASTLVVYYQLGTQPAVEMNPISSYTYQLNSITQNYSIVVRAPSLQVFNVNLPTSTYFSITSDNETNTVYYDNDYSFSLQVDSQNGYTDVDMQVYYMFEGKDKQLLSANEGVYTISNIKSNVSILVENVHLILYEIQFENVSGVEYWNSNGNDKFTENQFVSYGNNFEFKVILSELYNKSVITVYNNDVAINMNAKNNYVIRQITSNCAITVVGAIMNLADYSKLQSAVAVSLTYKEGFYTTDSLNTFKIARNNAMATLNETHTQDEQYIIDNTTNALLTAYDNLTLKPADYSELNAVLNEVPQDLYKYTEQSRLALMEAIKNYKSDLNITQQDIVDGYVSVIRKATEGLVPTEVEIDLASESNFLLYLVGGASICIIMAMLIIMFIDHKKRTTGGEVFSKKMAKQAANNATNNANATGNANNANGTQNINAVNGANTPQQNTYNGYNQQQGWQQYNGQYGTQNGYNNPYAQNGYNNQQQQNQNGYNMQNPNKK